MTYPVTFYARPLGKTAVLEMKEITDDDAAWLKQHNVKLSAEMAGPIIILYADYGNRDEEGEPIEHIYLTKPGENCTQAMSNLVNELRVIVV